MTATQSKAERLRWKTQREKESNHMDKLTQEDREALQWARQHRANVQTRNNVLKGIGILIEVILLGGVLNYYMLAPIATQYLSSFLAEFGFVGFLILLNSAIIAKSFRVDKDTAVVAAVALAAVVAAALAAAVALAAAAAVVVAVAAYMLLLLLKG